MHCKASPACLTLCPAADWWRQCHLEGGGAHALLTSDGGCSHPVRRHHRPVWRRRHGQGGEPGLGAADSPACVLLWLAGRLAAPHHAPKLPGTHFRAPATCLFTLPPDWAGVEQRRRGRARVLRVQGRQHVRLRGAVHPGARAVPLRAHHFRPRHLTLVGGGQPGRAGAAPPLPLCPSAAARLQGDSGRRQHFALHCAAAASCEWPLTLPTAPCPGQQPHLPASPGLLPAPARARRSWPPPQR